MTQTATHQIHAPIIHALRPNAPAVPGPLAVRAGDFLRLGNDFRLALELAEIACTLAEDAGASPRRMWRLRAALSALR